MRCDCCHQKSVTECYDIKGIIIDLCSECFTEFQLEVFDTEYPEPNRDFFILIMRKMGIEPKR